MNAAAPGRVPSPARLTPGARVGGVNVGTVQRTTAIAELYSCERGTLHVLPSDTVDQRPEPPRIDEESFAATIAEAAVSLVTRNEPETHRNLR